MSDERKVFTNNSATELKNIWDERERGMEESKEGRKEEGKKEGKEGKPKPLISLEIENCIRNKEAKKITIFLIKDIAHSRNACSVPNTLQNDLISTHFYLITNLSVRWQKPRRSGHRGRAGVQTYDLKLKTYSLPMSRVVVTVVLTAVV